MLSLSWAVVSSWEVMLLLPRVASPLLAAQEAPAVLWPNLMRDTN